MRVRIESVAEHWAQRPGSGRSANCLASSRLLLPGGAFGATADSRLPSVSRRREAGFGAARR